MSYSRSLTDSQLLALIKNGDETAFAEIYDRYWSVLYLHVLKMIGDEDDSKDLIQEVFTTLWLKGSQIEFSTNISGYLYVSARNRVINMIRQNKVRKNYLDSLAEYGKQWSNTTLEQLNVRDLNTAVEREVQALPCRMREIFELSRKQNLSHKEIALRLEISDKTVKKQISNALRILKLRLNILVAVTAIGIGLLNTL